MEFIIELVEADEITCINRIAQENRLSTEEYMTNIVRGWIKQQLRGQYIRAARDAELGELKTALKSTVDKLEQADRIKAQGR